VISITNFAVAGAHDYLVYRIAAHVRLGPLFQKHGLLPPRKFRQPLRALAAPAKSWRSQA
jgi:hypothetical protein